MTLSPSCHAYARLTGLLDRRGMEAALEAADPAAPVAVAVVDVDGSGSVKETYGHGVGDRVLQQLARRFEAVAPEAALGRWGPGAVGAP